MEQKCSNCSQALYEGTKHICSGPSEDLDELLNKMSEFVSKHGPKVLTRGMNNREAHESIMACLEKLKGDLDGTRI